MKVLVDTSVWSLVLRKKPLNVADEQIVSVMRQLIFSNSVEIIGAIRQEILSGIPNDKTFRDMTYALMRFKDLEINTEIHIKAAEYFNKCRKHGIQGSHIDFLICSAANTYNIPIFTLDKDFQNYKKYLPIIIFEFETFST